MWPTQEVIQEILPGLFQGNWDTNSDVLSKYKIGAILNASPQHYPPRVTNACVFSRTALLEIPEEPVSQEAILQYFDKTSDFIHEHRNVGKNVFVHCQPWSSTSVSSKISIAYLIKYAGLSIADARTKISNPVEGHSEVLLNWEQEITRRMGLRPIPLDLEEIQLHCEICHKPIHNACFKCANCESFTICDVCETLLFLSHPPDHLFYKLKQPISTRLPLLPVQNRAIGYTIHDGFNCDQCKQLISTPARYRCVNCDDFDLCGQCEKMHFHDPSHVFLKIRFPITPGKWTPFKLPLLYPPSLPSPLIPPGQLFKVETPKSKSPRAIQGKPEVVDPPCFTGLFNRFSGASVALDSLQTTVLCHNSLASVELSYKYKIPSTTINAEFILALNRTSTFVGIEISIDNKEFTSSVVPKLKTQNGYSSIANQHVGRLLNHRAVQIYGVLLGDLLPGITVIVKVKCVLELYLSDISSIELKLPSLLIPKLPEPSSSDPWCYKTPSYRFTCVGQIFTKTPIVSITAPAHEVTLSQTSELHAEINYSNELGLHKDFVVKIKQADLCKLALLHVELSGSNFFELSILPMAHKPPTVLVSTEFIFLVDRSALAVSGAQVKNALYMAILSLPGGCWFNITVFDCFSKSLFENSQIYAKSSVAQAIQFINGLTPSNLGSDFVEPLLQEYQTPIRQRGTTRQVFLISGCSDGSDVQTLVKLLEINYKSFIRLFAFGVGLAVSKRLLWGIAHATKGNAQFVKPHKFLEKYLLNQIHFCLFAPALTDLKLSCSGAPQKSLEVPKYIPAAYPTHPLHVYGTSSVDLIKYPLTLTGTNWNAPFSVVVSSNPPVQFPGLSTKIANSLIAENKLTAQGISTIKKLSLQHAVVSPFTSLVIKSQDDTHLPVITSPVWKLEEESKGNLNNVLGALSPADVPEAYQPSFLKIVNLQIPDRGSWNDSPALRDIISSIVVNFDKANSSKPAGLSEELWGTALALVTLEKLSSDKSYWTLYYNKGLQYLLTCKLSSSLIEELLEKARQAFQQKSFQFFDQ